MKLSNVVYILAVSSLVMYILGPTLGIIKPTGVINFTWAYERSCADYYHILYAAQSFSVSGQSIIRNCGIFTEAPMFNFLLCLSLGTEMFIRKTPKLIRNIILSVTIVSTFTTTGYFVLLAAWFFRFYIKMQNDRKLHIKKLLFPLVVVVAFSIIIYLLQFKTSYSVGLNSVSIRVNHLMACTTSWLNHFFVGSGFNNELYVLQYSLFNQGMSVGLPFLFATGGLVLGLVFCVPLLISCVTRLKGKQYQQLAFLVVIIICYFLTAVTYRPIMIFLLCFLINWSLNNDKYEGQYYGK